eukprot:scaffold50_cov162-Ochromonas_danica.AAC.15
MRRVSEWQIVTWGFMPCTTSWLMRSLQQRHLLETDLWTEYDAIQYTILQTKVGHELMSSSHVFGLIASVSVSNHAESGSSHPPYT